jgi:hypothetical protein
MSKSLPSWLFLVCRFLGDGNTVKPWSRRPILRSTRCRQGDRKGVSQAVRLVECGAPRKRSLPPERQAAHWLAVRTPEAKSHARSEHEREQRDFSGKRDTKAGGKGS